MWVFTDALFFSFNKFTPPGTPGQFTWWSGHTGGNQGILQTNNGYHPKLQLGCDHRLAGAGDNQVVAVRFSRSEDPSS